jgi:hypothetical protein
MRLAAASMVALLHLASFGCDSQDDGDQVARFTGDGEVEFDEVADKCTGSGLTTAKNRVAVTGDTNNRGWTNLAATIMPGAGATTLNFSVSGVGNNIPLGARFKATLTFGGATYQPTAGSVTLTRTADGGVTGRVILRFVAVGPGACPVNYNMPFTVAINP